MFGWTGKILRIDLTEGRYWTEEPDSATYRAWLGGRGLAGYLSAPYAERSWDDPAAPLIFMSGPLAGTDVPNAGICRLVCRSPLTRAFADAPLGGQLGVMLKRAGWDGVVVQGKAARLTVIEIVNRQVSLREAPELAGRRTGELLKELQTSGAVVSVGPAAERGVIFADLFSDGHGVGGCLGLGLSFFAKNLKGLIVEGQTSVAVKDPEALRRAHEDVRRLIAASPALFGDHGFVRCGAAAILDLAAACGLTSKDNFRRRSRSAVAALNAHCFHAPHKVGCADCDIRCRPVGSTAGDGAPLPSEEAIAFWSSAVGDVPAMVVEIQTFCWENGLDCAAVGSAWQSMEERVKRRHTGDEIRAILREAAENRGALTEYDPRKSAAEVLTVKGRVLPPYDPRAAYGTALSFAVACGGPDVERAGMLGPELLRKPAAVNALSFAGKARMVKNGEDLFAVADSLGICAKVFLACSLEEYAKAFSAVTGMEVAEGDLLKIGARIIRHERALNVRNGFTNADDDLPVRFFEEAGGPGFTPLDRGAFLEAREVYYRIRDADEARSSIEKPGIINGSGRGGERRVPTRNDALLADKCDQKLAAAGLANPGTARFCFMDDLPVWNRADADSQALDEIIRDLNVNALLYCRPREPYFSIMNFLAAESPNAVRPEDCETRTFLHDIPVVRRWEATALAEGLKRRKAVIVPGRGVVAKGAWGLEQAFSIFSSVCFSTFVKFMADSLRQRRAGCASSERERIWTQALAATDVCATPPPLDPGPFATESAVRSALSAAGRALVEMRLVDSNFGNVSYRLGDVLCISQTGAPLDELENGLVFCPLDDSACSAAIASSEFIAHREIVSQADVAAVLHGHPKYSVILSLFCEKSECESRGTCHRACPEPRFVGDVPIVPGEVGAGPFGLCHTLPPAIQGKRGVIVYGHGLFTVGKKDFNEALRNLADIEKQCRTEYLRLGNLAD